MPLGPADAPQGWTAPALTVAAGTVLLRARRLPLPGEVLVRPGQSLASGDTVAETRLPGRALPLPLAGLLGCEPGEVQRFLEVRPGQAVCKGQRLALFPGVWGIGRREVVAPADGVVEGLSARSGHLLLRGLPTALRLDAHLPGVVSQVWPGQGCEVRCRGALVQGVFGVGGEVRGRIRLMHAADGPVRPSAGDAGDLQGAVCVAELADGADLAAWATAGAVAAIVGGIGYRELTAFCVRHPRFTVVLTEGFGRLPMAPRALDVLRGHEGASACVDGTTQIRAGVVRPEVVVPLGEGGAGAAAESGTRVRRPLAGAGVGARVRIVRAPDFGRTGVILQGPAAPRAIGSEAVLPVVLVRLDGGGSVLVPRANVEPVD